MAPPSATAPSPVTVQPDGLQPAAIAAPSINRSLWPARFEVAYRECQTQLHRYVVSIVRDRHLAEDVLQTAVTRAFEAMSRASEEPEYRPWLFRIAHNEAINRVRRDRQTVELSEGLESPVASVHEIAERNHEVEQLWH